MISQTQANEAARILERMADLCAKVKADIDEAKRVADEWRAEFEEKKD